MGRKVEERVGTSVPRVREVTDGLLDDSRVTASELRGIPASGGGRCHEEGLVGKGWGPLR